MHQLLLRTNFHPPKGEDVCCNQSATKRLADLCSLCSWQAGWALKSGTSWIGVSPRSLYLCHMTSLFLGPLSSTKAVKERDWLTYTRSVTRSYR